MKLNKAQSEAISTIGTNVLVCASAGGGKTTVLVNRLLKRIIEDKVSLDDIVAMTFTEAAATNMKNRLAAALKTRIQEATAVERGYLEEQLAHLPDARISTIHSFCLSITKEYYYLLGLSKKTCDNIIDEARATIVKAKLLDQIINDHLINDGPNIKALSQAVSGELFAFENLKKAINTIYRKANAQIDPLAFFDRFHYRKITNLQDYDETKMTVYLDLLKNRLSSIGDNYYKLADFESGDREKYYLIAQEITGLLSDDDYADLVNKLQEILFLGKKAKDNPEFNKLRDETKDLIDDLAKRLLAPASIINAHNDTIIYRQTLLEMAKELYLAYQDYKRQNEWIDFDDFEHYAYRILTINEGAIAAKYRHQFQEIMIDEFQDTNDIQYTIAALIANDNLFLVGDVKQSIYRFRKARPDIMMRLRHDPSFKIIHMQNNYRSKANIVAFGNRLFERIMNIGQKAFAKEDAQITDLDEQFKDQTEIEFDLFTYQKKTAGQKKDEYYKAHLLLRRVIKENRKGTAFKDIAVLVRTHNEKIMIKKVFDEYNVPYLIKDNEGYFNSYAIETVFAYLSYLIDDDKIAKTAVLASLYRLNSDQLIDYAGDEAIDKDRDQLRSLLLKGDIPAFFAYLLKINNFYLRLDKKERANIDLLLSKLTAYRIDSFRQLYDLIKETMKDQKETASISDDESDAVKIMTIHNSKGLEFDTVCLYSSSRNESKENSDNVLIDENLGFGLKYTYGPDRIAAKTLEVNLILEKNDMEDIFEYERLLYVALTRAKRSLFIVDAFKEEEFTSGLKMLYQRKGFSSYLLSSTDDSLKINRYEQLEPIGKLPSANRQTAELPLINYPGQRSTKLAPSALENTSRRLFESSRLGLDMGTRIHDFLAAIDLREDDWSLLVGYHELPLSFQDKLAALHKNPVFQKAVQGEYHQEYSFYQQDDDIIIHGYIDLIAFCEEEVIIIDYKNDKMKEESAFIKRYQNQINAYKQVIARTTDKPIKGYIYAFELQKMIAVE